MSTSELVAAYHRARRAAEGESGDEEITLLWNLVEDLMEYAGIAPEVTR